MHLGAAMSGGNPADGRVEKEFYPTPSPATVALLDRYADVLPPGRVWEPACGEGHMAQIIRARGFEVVCSDAFDHGFGKAGVDFTRVRRLPKGVTSIITNPPWARKISPLFVRQARILQPKFFALLLKSTYFHAAERRALYEAHPPTAIHPLTWRLDFQNKGRPVIECSWFVWDERGPLKLYEPMEKPR